MEMEDIMVVVDVVLHKADENLDLGGRVPYKSHDIMYQICKKDGHPTNKCWWLFEDNNSYDKGDNDAYNVDTNWYPDSGAMNHITSNLKQVMICDNCHKEDKIHMANGEVTEALAVCNPFAGTYRLLPTLGSAWARHGTVLAGPGGVVLVLTELAALSYTPSEGSAKWMKHPLSLPSKPRSPILAAGARAVFALCDVGTPWRSQWKLYSCPLAALTGGWAPVERAAWGDVFEILKRPRLLAGAGGRRVLMIGGLRSSFAIDAPCSTVLILRLDLATMEWDEAGRMPPNMYRCFTGLCEAAAQGSAAMPAPAAGGNNKVKVFGGDGKVWFAGKRVRGKLAMWEEDDVGSTGGKWDWVDGVPGYGDGVYRGFVFDGGFTAMP
uniref:Uncharacterized protein n=1 Tax=Avena sativa TaxID=4498 RepID=A0ACD5WM69_AVESA